MAKANLLRFSTKYQDDETGDLYYGLRYYNASTGRWLSKDPIGELGGPNLYGFLLSAPTLGWDYLGCGDSYWGDVAETAGAMGRGVGHGAGQIGYFFGDLLLGFVVVVVPESCSCKLLNTLDNMGYQGSQLTTDAGGSYGGLKTGAKVFVAPVLAPIGVGVSAYKSVNAAMEGDLETAGRQWGEGSLNAALTLAPYANGPSGTGGYTGVGTLGEAMYNLTPKAMTTLPRRTQLQIRSLAGRRAEGALLEDMGPDAVTQLQIRPRLANGKLAEWWFTADGICKRGGGFEIREFKASTFAPLTKGQTEVDPILWTGKRRN